MSTLTNRTIRSTYGQLIQLEDTLFQDGFGTGSLSGSYELTGSQFISGTLHVTGNLEVTGTASIGYLETIYETSSIIYSSGSTKFGDDTSDTHEFTGSVTISGSAYSEDWSGSFSGSFFGLIDSASNAERSVTASQADRATTSSIANKTSNLLLEEENSSGATHYVVFGSNTTGETGPKTDGALSYLPQTETLTATKFLGQLEGSASYAATASILLGSVISSSHSETASLAISTSVEFQVTNSFAQSGDGPFTGSFSSSLYSLLSGSFTGSSTGSFFGILTGTASQADNATTASHALTLSQLTTASFADRATSASQADNATTASHIVTASYADDATTASFAETGDGIFSGSFNGAFEGDGTLLTGSYTVDNSANNRVITSVDDTNGNAEENLTFDGTTLTIAGNINTGQGTTEIYLMNQNVRTSDDVTFDVVSASAFTETSTIRSKENVESLDNAEVVYKLRPVSFDWKTTGKHDIGLIAEETLEHLPEIVQVGADGQAEGIKYSKLTSLLIKAVQDQQHQIEELTRRINWLDNHV
jgi:hypothetical protein